MERLVAIVLILAVLVAGAEYAVDYVEAFEGTPLAALADGHDADDGHAPSEHQAPCDGCHCGGVHLTAFPASASAPVPSAAAAVAPWREPLPAARDFAPPFRPPIV